jgi:transposase
MLHPKMRHVYVGLDIHRQTHTAVVINCFGEKLGEITFNNKPVDFGKLLKEVQSHIGAGITPVFGLEDVQSSGRSLAVFLLSKNKAVKYVNPSLTYSERHNQTILHKTDSHDALCVARVLLNRMDELPDADPKDTFWMLSQLVSRRTAMVKASVALKNQIHAYIIHHYPSYRKFFYVFDCKTALEFWEKYPSPNKLKGTDAKALGEFLKLSSHNYFTEGKAVEILEYVAMDGDTTNEYQDTRDFLISSAVRQLKANNAEIAGVEKQIKGLLPLFDYKLETMKGIDSTTAAILTAEIGDINRFSSADKLAKYAGISPVSYSSGKTDKLLCNVLGDRKLNRVFFTLAVTVVNCAGDSGKPVNEIFHRYYKKKISEGKTKKQALKCVMRRLVNIIYGMMKNKTEYREPDTKMLTEVL